MFNIKFFYCMIQNNILYIKLFICGMAIILELIVILNITFEIFFSLLNCNSMTNFSTLYMLTYVHFNGLVCLFYVLIKTCKSFLTKIFNLNL